MPAARSLRLRCQDLPVNPFSLSEPPGAVMLNGIFQRVPNGLTRLLHARSILLLRLKHGSGELRLQNRHRVERLSFVLDAIRLEVSSWFAVLLLELPLAGVLLPELFSIWAKVADCDLLDGWLDELALARADCR